MKKFVFGFISVLMASGAAIAGSADGLVPFTVAGKNTALFDNYVKNGSSSYIQNETGRYSGNLTVIFRNGYFTNPSYKGDGFEKVIVNDVGDFKISQYTNVKDYHLGISNVYEFAKDKNGKTDVSSLFVADDNYNPTYISGNTAPTNVTNTVYDGSSVRSEWSYWQGKAFEEMRANEKLADGVIKKQYFFDNDEAEKSGKYSSFIEYSATGPAKLTQVQYVHGNAFTQETVLDGKTAVKPFGSVITINGKEFDLGNFNTFDWARSQPLDDKNIYAWATGTTIVSEKVKIPEGLDVFEKGNNFEVTNVLTGTGITRGSETVISEKIISPVNNVSPIEKIRSSNSGMNDKMEKTGFRGMRGRNLD